MVRALIIALSASTAGACSLLEECYGPGTKDWPAEAPEFNLVRCCTHLKPVDDMNRTDECQLTGFQKGHYYYGRCCSDWGVCNPPAHHTTPSPTAYGTCGFVCDTDDDCKDCGGPTQPPGRCSKPYPDNPLLNSLTATCVESSLEEPPTEPKADYTIGVQPVLHYGNLRLVEYPSFVNEPEFGIGNIYYDGTVNSLRHDWSEYLGQGKQTQIYRGDGMYYIVLKSGICIDFAMKENPFIGRRVGVPTPDWLNTCAKANPSKLVYVGRELVNGEWADHFSCYVVTETQWGDTNSIAFSNWHSLGLGKTKLGQPLRVAGSNARPRSMPPSARLTTMFYSNISEGREAVPASTFAIPRGCLRVGEKHARAIQAAQEEQPAPASAADLRRARTRVPRSSLQGDSLGSAMVKLNKQLLGEEKLQTKACALHSLEELHEAQRVLFAARSDELQSTYPEDDRRAQYHTSAEALLDHQEQQLADAAKRPDLLHIMRDGLCHEIVMMYAHHLTEQMRQNLKSFESLFLPLLPEHEMHPEPEAGDEMAKSIYGGYFKGAACLTCHVDVAHSTNAITV